MNKLVPTLVGSAVLATGALGLSALDAEAFVLSSLACTNGTVTYDGSGFTQCAGAYASQPGDNFNPTSERNLLNSANLGGINNWTWDKKIETPGSGDNGTNILGFSITPTNGATSGQWGFTNMSYNGPIVLSLKSSTRISFYYFASITGNNSLLGSWNTNGVSLNPQGNPQGLSHASLYYVNDPDNFEPVPEPLTMLGVGAAVGFGSFFKKRLGKSKSK